MSISRMQTYGELQRQQQALEEQMKKHDMKCASCPKCQCQFFEQIEVSKYKANHTLILGQEIPVKPGSQPYKFLRCVGCKEIIEPNVLNNSRDILGGDYDQLLDLLEEKEKVEKEKKKDGSIPSQEL